MKFKKFFIALIALGLLLSVTATALAGGSTVSVTKSITAGKNNDVYNGNGGVYFSNSVYDGKVTLTRMVAAAPYTHKAPKFHSRLSEYHLYQNNTEIKSPRGYIYVYFNLDKTSKPFWDKGDISVFHYNTKKAVWQECSVVVYIKSKNTPYGRLACVTNESGVFGLGLK
jgi:hypothetical protein